MRSRVLVALMSVVLLVSACGSDKKSSDDAGSSSGKAPVTLSGQVNDHGTKDATGSSKLEVEADDFYFSPTFIKASAGESLTLEVKNEGKAPHTFTTADGSVDEQIAPGSSKTVTVKAPASGVLVWHCRFHGGQGMQGAVFLHEGDAGGASGSGSTTSSSGGYGY